MPLTCSLCGQAALLAPVAIWIHKSPWISHLTASLMRAHWALCSASLRGWSGCTQCSSLPCSQTKSIPTAKHRCWPSPSALELWHMEWEFCQALLHPPFLESAHWNRSFSYKSFQFCCGVFFFVLLLITLIYIKSLETKLAQDISIALDSSWSLITVTDPLSKAGKVCLGWNRSLYMCGYLTKED